MYWNIHFNHCLDLLYLQATASRVSLSDLIGLLLGNLVLWYVILVNGAQYE